MIEVLPPARSELDEPADFTLTNREAWALWDYLQDERSLPYWEHGLSGVGQRLKEWIVTTAPWGEPEPGHDLAPKTRR